MTLLASNTLTNQDLSSKQLVLEYTLPATTVAKHVIGRLVLGTASKPLSGTAGIYVVEVTIGGAAVSPVSRVQVEAGNDKILLSSRYMTITPGGTIKIYLTGLPPDTSVDLTAELWDITPITASQIPTIGSGSVAVDHDYTCPDGLAYKTDAGIGIDNAEIRIYLATDYDVGHLSNNYIKATTTTDVNGRWRETLMLDPGDYVVYAFRQPDYGPDIIRFTVTAP